MILVQRGGHGDMCFQLGLRSKASQAWYGLLSAGRTLGFPLLLQLQERSVCSKER